MRPCNAARCTAAAALLALLAVPGAAAAAPPPPQWTISAVSAPTDFAPGDESGDDAYRVTVVNSGGSASDGSPVTISDQLPGGLSLDPAGATGEDQLTHKPISCVALSCTFTGPVPADDSLTLTFPVDVALSAGQSTVTNRVTASGGGGGEEAMSTPTAISPAPAAFGVAPGGAATALSTDQAGAHADLTTAIAFDTTNAQGATAGDPKDATADLPPGLAGDLPDTPSCPIALFSHRRCPIATQVGVTTLAVNLGSGIVVASEPLYDLSPDAGEVAKIGFNALAFNIQGDISLQPGGAGLRTSFHDVATSAAQLDSVVFTVWGVPADPSHDALRWNPGDDEFGAASEATPAAFLANPTACSGEPLRSTLSIDSWEQPGSDISTEMPFGPITGCERLSFEPTIQADPTTDSASAPTGLALDLSIPQTYDNPGGLATPQLADVAVALPEGISLNPSAGAGLGSCTQAQLAQEGAVPSPGAGCPGDSKVGTVRIDSPSIAEEATGSLFLATPYDNPFGSLLALYLVARVPDRGVLVEAAGKVAPDPATGRLTTTFEGLPPLPFSDLSLGFRQGATAPLISPPQCGEFSTRAELTPYSDPGEGVAASAGFRISHGVGGGACPAAGPAPFHPQVSAGTLDDSAGAYSTLYQDMSRGDGEEEITHFTAHYPPGLTGRLAGIPFCPNAAIEAARTRSGAAEEADPSCPAASQIGRTMVGAGVGSVLSWAPGRIYLSGPYEGSGLSTVAITAARVGPFDLGTVVVRTALRIDPETGHASIDSAGSAPIPHIIDGIPLHIRDIQVYVDRSPFILNPTSCDPFAIEFAFGAAGADPLSAVDGVHAGASVPFQVTNCSRLPFAPKLSLRLRGGTKRADHPSFSATVTTTPGEANSARAEVILPHSEFLDNAAIGTVCTRVQFSAGQCPAASIYGHATAESPLLSEPLQGPVYLRSSEHTLPDVVVALHNAEIDIVLDGHVDSVGGRLRNTFEALPDAPVTRFTISLPGGKKGLLVNSKDLCEATYRATIRLTGQNGKTTASRQPLRPPGCAKRKHDGP